MTASVRRWFKWWSDSSAASVAEPVAADIECLESRAMLSPMVRVIDAETQRPIADGGTARIGARSEIGGSLAARTFLIRNEGQSLLQCGAISFPNSEFSFAREAGGFPVAIAAGGYASFTVRMTFNDHEIGQRVGSLSFQTNDPNVATFDMTLVGDDVAYLPVSTQIVDNSDLDFHGTGFQAVTGGHNGTQLIDNNGSGYARWAFSELPPGEYRVSSTWTSGADRANQVAMLVRNSSVGRVLTSGRINQRQAPDDFVAAGRAWETIGTFRIEAGDRSKAIVEMTNVNTPTNRFVADAVLLERIDPLPTSIGIAANSDFRGSWRYAEGVDIFANPTPIGLPSYQASTFSVVPGKYRVWVSPRIGQLNRESLATNAPYRLRETTTSPLLVGTRLNQQVPPRDLVEATKVWSELGTVDVNGTTLLIQLGNDANGIVVASDFRIQRIASDTVDDGELTFSTTAGWTTSTSGRNGDVQYANAGNGSAVATWTFLAQPPGSYRVYATWPPASNRASNATYRVRGSMNGPDLLTKTLSQRQAPNDFSLQGANWETLGTVTTTDGRLFVQLTNAANGVVIADSIRIERVPVAILDDSSPAFTTTGTWTGTTSGRNNSVRYAAAGTGTSLARWSFSNLATGGYFVSVTWPPAANRGSNVTYRVRSELGGPVLLSGTVNQKLAPIGDADQGSTWQLLGRVQVGISNRLIVEVGNDANGFVMADAVRIERIYQPISAQ